MQMRAIIRMIWQPVIHEISGQGSWGRKEGKDIFIDIRTLRLKHIYIYTFNKVQ